MSPELAAVPATGRLVARTHPLHEGADLDLVAVAGETGVLWARGDVGFAGRGVACTIEVPPGDPAAAAATVHQTLGAIDHLDASPSTSTTRAGQGAVALGALPFDPGRGGTLVVPAVLVGRDEHGRAWITTVGPASDVDPTGAEGPFDLVARLADDDIAAAPTRYTVTSSRPPDDWCRSVAAARDELRAGVARKVVLAREVVIDTDRPLSRRALLEQLRRSYPAAMLFAAHGFVGASPELLVERIGDRVRSHPMAGTAPRSGDPTVDASLAADLLASGKDQIEHRFTIDMVHDTLLPWCSYLDEEAAPSIVAMANVQHLATLVEGRLSSPPASVIELMRALHPTPAVNGAPRQVALDLIGRHEGLDRGRYGGPVGWVDAAGNGAWTVGIRSAELSGTRARLFAGVGVVADSDPTAELAETRAKFEALLNAILRP